MATRTTAHQDERRAPAPPGRGPHPPGGGLGARLVSRVPYRVRRIGFLAVFDQLPGTADPEALGL